VRRAAPVWPTAAFSYATAQKRDRCGRRRGGRRLRPLLALLRLLLELLLLRRELGLVRLVGALLVLRFRHGPRIPRPNGPARENLTGARFPEPEAPSGPPGTLRCRSTHASDRYPVRSPACGRRVRPSGSCGARREWAPGSESDGAHQPGNRGRPGRVSEGQDEAPVAPLGAKKTRSAELRRSLLAERGHGPTVSVA